MSGLVPTVHTAPSMRDFAAALLRCWPEATKAGAGILWAHFAGETGAGRYCWGWNLGNWKWTEEQAGPVWAEDNDAWPQMSVLVEDVALASAPASGGGPVFGGMVVR